MQDLRSMTDGGRLFGCERRLRPFPNQSVNCPRCDSLNTKFCYYNNYNLSQPRHFCKSCRRYWTKGGVLRNVPVGGGCRKTKKLKPKPASSNDDLVEKEIKKTTTSHSSGDSSSLTAATTTEASSSTTSAAAMLNFTTDSSGSVVSQNTNPNNSSFKPASMMQLNNLDEQFSDSGIFGESGSFTCLMNTSSNSEYLGFNLTEISPFRLPHQQQEHQQQKTQVEEEKMMTTMSLADELKGFYDQTVVPGEMPGLANRTTATRGTNGELTALDWQSNNSDHQGLFGSFDLPGTIVDQAYWSQISQRTDNDHPLYLP